MSKTPRILIDGREIPGLVAVDATRCLAIVHQLDPDGHVIRDADGLPIQIRRAGKIEFPDADP